MQSKPSPRVGAVLGLSASDPHSIYLFGGKIQSPSYRKFTDIWQYNILTNQWSLITDSITPPSEAPPRDYMEAYERDECGPAFPASGITGENSSSTTSTSPIGLLFHDLFNHAPGQPISECVDYYLLHLLSTRNCSNSIESALVDLHRLSIRDEDGSLKELDYAVDGTQFLSCGDGVNFYVFQPCGETQTERMRWWRDAPGELHKMVELDKARRRLFFDVYHINVTSTETGNEDHPQGWTMEWRCISNTANMCATDECRQTMSSILEDGIPISFLYHLQHQHHCTSYLAVMPAGQTTQYEAAHLALEDNVDPATQLDEYEQNVRRAKGYPIIRFNLTTREFQADATHPDEQHGFPLWHGGVCPVVVDTTLYLVGGRRPNVFRDIHTQTTLMERLWSLDLISLQWRLTDLRLKTPVSECSSVYRPEDSTIYVFGGKADAQPVAEINLMQTIRLEKS